MRLLSARFEKLRRLVRRTGYGGEFEYGGVVELTKRGIAHFHVLFRGPYLSQGLWSRLAVEAGFGRIVWIELASEPKLAGYVTKALPGYLAKDLTDSVAFPRHFRRVRFSRGWAPDWDVRRRGASDEAAAWELVRPGTSLMTAYLRVTTVGSRADPQGWSLEDEEDKP